MWKSRTLDDLKGDNHAPRSLFNPRPNLGYRLQEPPLIDSLYALSKLQQGRELAVVGGTAVALHIYQIGKMPYHNYRQTDDIDVIVGERLTRGDFNSGFGKDLCNELYKQGYQPEINPQKHKNLGVNVIPQDPFSDAFYINTPSMSQRLWNGRKDILYKEIKDSVEIGIPEREEKIKVASFEDLLAPKLIMGRDKDKADVALSLKYGPEVDPYRLLDMLELWTKGSEKDVKKAFASYQEMKAEQS